MPLSSDVQLRGPGEKGPLKRAMMLRLSSEAFLALKAALVKEAAGNKKPAIEVQFGDHEPSALFIGGQRVELTDVPESVFEIYRQKRNPGKKFNQNPLQLYGTVSSSLTAKRVLNEDVVDRVHQRSQQAEEERTKRKAIYLGDAPQPGTGKKRKVTSSQNGASSLAKQALSQSRRTSVAATPTPTITSPNPPISHTPPVNTDKPLAPQPPKPNPPPLASSSTPLSVVATPPRRPVPKASNKVTDPPLVSADGFLTSTWKGGLKGKADATASNGAKPSGARSKVIKSSPLIDPDLPTIPASAKSSDSSSASSASTHLLAAAASTPTHKANGKSKKHNTSVDDELVAAAAAPITSSKQKKKPKVEDELVAAAAAIPAAAPLAPKAKKKVSGKSPHDRDPPTTSRSRPSDASAGRAVPPPSPKMSPVAKGLTNGTKPQSRSTAPSSRASATISAPPHRPAAATHGNGGHSRRASARYTSSSESDTPPLASQSIDATPAVGRRPKRKRPNSSRATLSIENLSKPLPTERQALREEYDACYVKYSSAWARILAEKHRQEQLLKQLGGADDEIDVGEDTDQSGEDVEALLRTYNAFHDRLGKIRAALGV
ncbi:hypothetical protein BS47DRAFT_1338091 [Hydnum rufescens UP504]|uniref:Uncharacterized protein n=1 Tax=Hydnum rufescens UP504 TaxID=1448309 RepID=A0A9P6DYN3_9AGAM|nr:hypothetical protein BS47DRAFT_1338091 [Hydnum rufescens UP504]